MKLTLFVVRCSLFGVALGVGACAGEQMAPADLLPREKFKAVLIEAQVLEARASFARVQDPKTTAADSTAIPLEAAYDSLFAAQGTTTAAFKSTFTWYTQHPAELKTIYEEVVEELGRRKDAGK